MSQIQKQNAAVPGSPDIPPALWRPLPPRRGDRHPSPRDNREAAFPVVSHPACPADPRSECVLVPSLRERNHGACPLLRLASSCRVRQGSAPCCFCAISYLVRALQVPPHPVLQRLGRREQSRHGTSRTRVLMHVGSENPINASFSLTRLSQPLKR